MKAEAIPVLTGESIAGFQVLTRQKLKRHRGTSGPRAAYLCQCQTCGHQQLVRAQNLRVAQAGGRQPWCRKCRP